jgi:general secretion pathway protein D
LATLSRRYRYAISWTLLLSIAVFAAPSHGQQPPVAPTGSTPTQSSNGSQISSKLSEALARRGDLTLRNSTLEGALYTISELFHVNIVTGSLEGHVNGSFRDAPLHEILDGILLSNGYGYRPAGESLVVSPLSEMGQVNPFFRSATISVQAAKIEEVVKGVEMLRSPQGRVQAIESARTIFVLDFPERVEMIEHVVRKIDEATMQTSGSKGGGTPWAPAPLEVGYFRTQFIPADTAKTALEAILSIDGRVAALEDEDRLLVVDHAQNLDMAKIVLERVDRPRPQVRITAMIYDISVEDIEQLGINWNQSLQGRIDANGDPQQLFSMDSIMQVPFGPASTGSTLTFMNLSRHFDLTGVVLAMQNARDSRLLAQPCVVVAENEEAMFQSVSEIPYQQLTETSGGGQIGTTAFKEAGITLRVIPKISSDGTVELDVSPEFSTLTGFTPGDNQPIIDRRTATTTVRVVNKQMVVIGGLRQRSDIGDFKGVPHLKDWKYVGRLFRARDTTVRESELVVFIVPEIVGYAPPLNLRERLVADTIGCRLDGIPMAEGCPNGCGPGMASSCETAQYGPVQYGPNHPPPAEQHGDGSLPPPAHEYLQPGPQMGKSPSGTPQVAQMAPRSMRRLPPTSGQVSAYNGPPEYSNVPLDVRRSGLRADYGQRFRATGGVDPNRQRVNQQALPAKTAERVDQPEGFFNRYLWR